MPRGGLRPGAGRKKGSPNKATAERQARVASTGITPLDCLLGVMRNEEADFETRLDAAKAAAPYVHPRLSSVGIKDIAPRQSLEEIDARIMELLAEIMGRRQGSPGTPKLVGDPPVIAQAAFAADDEGREE